mmetsp:Transcript_8786/g.11050  ORF Transcript_8786/g.11050 Transcript_8786/m.11050 type:complete len:133 (-) Transcript_8786:127-525(-)
MEKMIEVISDIDVDTLRLSDLHVVGSDDDWQYGRSKKTKGKRKGRRDALCDDDDDGIEYADGDEDEEAHPSNEFKSSEECDNDLESGNTSEEESEAGVWKCEFCKKIFKCEAQFDNHLMSKKHKEKFKNEDP